MTIEISHIFAAFIIISATVNGVIMIVLTIVVVRYVILLRQVDVLRSLLAAICAEAYRLHRHAGKELSRAYTASFRASLDTEDTKP